MTTFSWMDADEVLVRRAQRGERYAFDREAFPAIPLYNGNPWFVPITSGWYRLQDRIEQFRARVAG